MIKVRVDIMVEGKVSVGAEARIDVMISARATIFIVADIIIGNIVSARVSHSGWVAV